DEPRPAGPTLPGGGAIGHGADGVMHMYTLTMQMLAAVLGEGSDRPVIDKTGLSGHYSIDIREPQRMAAPSASPGGSPEEDNRPAIADALKSVGLELKPAKEPVEFLVIDHVDRPTEN
ncbi:MAG TPA: TIGR03435 family protein, partial [Acidobacteriaceae bacterium]